MRKKYSEKLVFHIPEMCFLDGELKAVDISEFRARFEADLHTIGIDGWYELQSTGHYQNRNYPQTLMVVFCRKEEARDAVMAFYKAIEQHKEMLKQESYAYERNGALNIIGL